MNSVLQGLSLVLVGYAIIMNYFERKGLEARIDELERKVNENQNSNG